MPLHYNLVAERPFQASEMTRAMEIMPTTHGRIGQMGIFRPRGVPTTNVMVFERNHQLVLLPTKARGGEPNVTARERRKARYFDIPHIPLADHINPVDIQNLLAFSTQNRLENLLTYRNERLLELRGMHEQTHEYHRVGAIQGIVYDADGTDVIVNWFDEFGIGAAVTDPYDFELDVGTTNVLQKCLDLLRYYERNMQGEVMTGLSLPVSPEFLDALVVHPNVKAAYSEYQAAAQRLGGDMRSGFTFGGITFWEYDPRTTAPNGTELRYISAGEGHAFPLGTRTTFQAVAAPPNVNSMVNKLGRVFYASVAEAKHGQGWDLWTESNVLHMCTRPHLLRRVVMY